MLVLMTRTMIFSLSAMLFLTGCSTLFMPGIPRDPVERLQYDIDRIVSDSTFIPARASILVESLDAGDLLYERDSKLLMRPASNTKLLSSAAAIALLGADFQFRTAVMADTPVTDGVATGNLYIKGYGNPDLTSADLDSIAQLIARSGIHTIQGDVIAETSYFDSIYWGHGWQWDDEPWEYAAFISPLSVNDNCVRVTVTPGTAAGDTVVVSLHPATEYVKLINRAVSVADTAVNPLRVSRSFVMQRENVIAVDGEMVAGKMPREIALSVWKPELYAATLLKEALVRQGVAVHGTVRSASTPEGTHELVVHRRGLDSMVVNLNKISDNLAAENTLKTIGAERRGAPGSALSGLYEMRAFLSTIGIDTTRFQIVDGSGLSYYNLLSADMLVQLLRAMAQRPEWFPLYYASLPIAGVDGTLRTRMRGTLAENNLRAKTGSIGGVSTLSGYVTTRDGERLVFSILMQNFIGGNRAYRDAQDRIGALLASFSHRRAL